MRKAEEVVKDHLMYLDAVQEFTDWLHSAKEELHRWSDMSGDSSATQKKLSKIKVRKWTDFITSLFLGSWVSHTCAEDSVEKMLYLKCLLPIFCLWVFIALHLMNYRHKQEKKGNSKHCTLLRKMEHSLYASDCKCAYCCSIKAYEICTRSVG